MTLDEQIEVMTAFKNGKKIEMRCKTSQNPNWLSATSPNWNWSDVDFRVKKEPAYRPYKDTDEMIEDFCERFDVLCSKSFLPPIWVKMKKDSNWKGLIASFTTDFVTFGDKGKAFENLKKLFNNYTYLDGSPCGKEEEK